MASSVHVSPGDYTICLVCRSVDLQNGVPLDRVWCHRADDIVGIKTKIELPARLIVAVFVSIRHIGHWLPGSVCED